MQRDVVGCGSQRQVGKGAVHKIAGTDASHLRTNLEQAQARLSKVAALCWVAVQPRCPCVRREGQSPGLTFIAPT